ncbi:MAG: phenylalanine--tRNA ligase subunit beta [Lautropia sp.]|nr:phenylalanine--tRNA ligase subunit beta [Lautropia sp.]
MKIPEKWLRHYCNPPLDGAGLDHLLTMGGLEVEAREPVAGAFSGVVVARIVTAAKHPDADRLQVCEVDVGQDAPVQIVCGAPNARAGLVTACALPGAVLPGDFRIKKTKMRGVESAGMLCSGRELGMGEDHSGILELPADLSPGADLRTALDLDEEVFELKLTPNLAHCMSVTGVAREVAALADAAYVGPPMAAVPAVIEDRVPVSIEDPELCGRFAGRVIRGVNARAETPTWMKQRLERAGQRSISALVDISNYVLLELGRPTHIFDLAKLRGDRIVVRWGRQGEALKLLNEQSVAVGPDAQGLPAGVVCDAEGPVSLAGIMGGDGTAVSLETTDVYLEAAFWWPDAIMGRPRRYNFTTDAAQRFERGVDAESVVEHLEYLSQLVLAICGGRPGPVDDQLIALPERTPVRLRLSRLRRVSGLLLSAEDCENVFRRLALPFERLDTLAAAADPCKPSAAGDVVFAVTPPGRRFDLTIEEDLIEEVIRLHGYERIPTRAPTARIGMRPAPERHLDTSTLKRRWAGRDYQEVVNFSFVARADDQRFSPDVEPIPVMNPIAEHLNVMRTSTWSGLLDNLRHNLNRKAERVRLFEVGRVYLPQLDQPAGPLALAGIAQPLRLGVLAYGPALEPQWAAAARPVDFFDLKGDLAAAHPEIPMVFTAAVHPALHPGQSARVSLPDGTPLGWIGALHPMLIEALDLPGSVLLAELDWVLLQQRELALYQRVSRFPPVIRDMAVVLDEQVAAAAVLDEIHAVVTSDPDAVCVKHVRLFDEYRGKGLENKEKSLAFRLWMQHTDRTLSDAEVDSVQAIVLERLARRFKARLRT